MRLVSVLVLILTLFLLLPGIVQGQRYQAEWFAPDLRSPQLLASEVREVLAQATYLARRDLAACDNILVDEGRVREEVLLRAREHPVAVAAGTRAKVARVVITEKTIQVVFHDKCSVVILPGGDRDLRDLNVPELLNLTRIGLRSVFWILGDPAAQLPT